MLRRVALLVLAVIAGVACARQGGGCPCGGLERGSSGPVPVQQTPSAPAALADSDPGPAMVRVEPAAFLMGADVGKYPEDGESPTEWVRVPAAFAVDTTEVTVAQWRVFASSTRYATDAELFGWSFAFDGFVGQRKDDRVVHSAPWWVQVQGANWSHPLGTLRPQQLAADAEPVVHVSWNDAWAFCSWRGARLCTEAEWELAARGGAAQTDFPWGDKLRSSQGKFLANTWTGRFPTSNTLADGYAWLAPVMSYPPNAFGLYDVIGNVWEWVADDFRGTNRSGRLYTPPEAPTQRQADFKTEKGGSHMCHRSHCYRYHLSSRTGAGADSSATNIGFRCCKSL